MLEITTCFSHIYQKFLCGIPINDLGLEAVLSGLCDTENGVLNQETLLSVTIDHPLILKHPLKPDYQQSFLRSLIKKLEEAGVEISDRIYSRYCELFSAVSSDTSFRHYCLIGHDAIISMRESINLVSKGTTGLRTWEASHALINWCVAHSSILDGAHLLELGSGVGLSGIAISLLCKPALYCFSDCHPDVLVSLIENIKLNTIDWKTLEEHTLPADLEKRALWNGDIKDSKVAVLDLPWEDVPSMNFSVTAPDFILASDLVYDNRIFEVLSSAFNKFTESGSQIIMASTERNPETLSEFLNCLSSKGMKVEEDSVPRLCILPTSGFAVTDKIYRVTSQNCHLQMKNV